MSAADTEDSYIVPLVAASGTGDHRYGRRVLAAGEAGDGLGA